MKVRNLLFLVLLLFAVHANANCIDCPKPEKIYIQDHQVAFYDSKIFVHFENEILHVPALYSDEQGIYILMKKSNRCGAYEWKCKYCETCNSFDESDCIKCGREME